MRASESEWRMLRQMLKIRCFESNVIRLFQEDMVHGATHLYIGEEAIAVGAIAQLQEQDYVFSTHRGHGHCIAKGADVKKMMAELLGRSDGYSHGKGGSMHIADVGRHMMGANGIVGASLPLSLGTAMASSIRKDGLVTLCFFGDGASNQGTFHESLNLAGVWKLPVVFICENNQYAVGSRFEATSSSRTVAERAAAYGFPGIRVDGTDVLAVREAAAEAIARARAGEGPSLIECLAYRWTGHHAGDPATYRPVEEVEEWKKRDPIRIYEDHLMQNGLAEPEEIEGLREEMEEEIRQAVAYAKASPEPAAETLMTNVFTES